jgi:hypothetical protein
MQKNEVIIGRPVIHWKTVYDNGQRVGPKKSKIMSEVMDINEVQHCIIEGEENPVPIKNLDTLSPGSILSARLQGCPGMDDNSFKEATRKFFADRGVDVTIDLQTPTV